ncbi:hypothetical protein UY3_14435 [Chelonia mydas]|uniref:Uncharacterized protein n=1 Tax=Chelonia mydas TaxID=8469 RepID=M7ASW6_CHEMY|nr:hypothetical protein UY3_14435 [Chelonia mydas]
MGAAAWPCARALLLLLLPQPLALGLPLLPAACVSRITGSSPSQRLAKIRKIRKRKKCTCNEMFSDLMLSSHTNRVQMNAWRQKMSERRKAQNDREERWWAEKGARDRSYRGGQEHLGHDDDGYQAYCTVCCHKAMSCCCVVMQYHICQPPGDVQ